MVIAALLLIGVGISVVQSSRAVLVAEDAKAMVKVTNEVLTKNVVPNVAAAKVAAERAAVESFAARKAAELAAKKAEAAEKAALDAKVEAATGKDAALGAKSAAEKTAKSVSQRVDKIDKALNRWDDKVADFLRRMTPTQAPAPASQPQKSSYNVGPPIQVERET